MSKLVVLVDDDPDDLKRYTKVVTDLGYEAKPLYNANSAARIIKRGLKYGILFADSYMYLWARSNQGGEYIFNVSKKYNPDVPVIFLSQSDLCYNPDGFIKKKGKDPTEITKDKFKRYLEQYLGPA